MLGESSSRVESPVRWANKLWDAVGTFQRIGGNPCAEGPNYVSEAALSAGDQAYRAAAFDRWGRYSTFCVAEVSALGQLNFVQFLSFAARVSAICSFRGLPLQKSSPLVLTGTTTPWMYVPSALTHARLETSSEYLTLGT